MIPAATADSVPKAGLLSRLRRWGIGIAAALIVVLYGASFFLDEPLRRITERNINQNLKGYTVRLAGAHLQVLNLSLKLTGLTLFQQVHPDPPVVSLPAVRATIHWREILSGRLVGEVLLDRPKVTINLLQLSSEVSSPLPLKERGWQQALEQIYPLKINTVTVRDASVTFIDQDPGQPLVLSHLNLKAANIRSIRQAGAAYPSPFHLDTAIFGSGRATVDGDANFLMEPHPGVKAHFKLDRTPVEFFKSAAARANLSITGGILNGSGVVEYAPSIKTAHLKDLTIQGMRMEYIHTQRTAAAEKKRARVFGKVAKKLTNKPGLLIQADQVHLTGCTIAMLNKGAHTPYRVFFTETDLHLSNFSNQFAQGPATARVKARFMGSGITRADATFRPEKNGPDFDLTIKVESTELTSLNDLLLNYGNFDVSAGSCALVAEMHIKDGRLSGYIKPFFKDLDVYDRRKDTGQGVMHQMYEMMVGGAAQLLENRSHQQVATRADFEGPVGNPHTSTWQIIGKLLSNAFLKAIVPDFEKVLTGSRHH